MLQKSYSDQYKSPTKNIHQSDPKSQPLLRPFIQFYYFLVGTGAIPVRLLIHENFGERSISPLALLTSLGFHLWYVFEYAGGFTVLGSYGVFAFFGIESFDINPETTFETIAFLSLFVINGFIIYLIEVFIINGKKIFKIIADSLREDPITKNSYSRGESVYFKIEDYLGKEKRTILGKQIIDESKFRMLIEPQKVFLYGLGILLLFLTIDVLLAAFFDSLFISWIVIFCLSCSSVGLLISLSAICLFLEEFGIHSRIRDSALDILDGGRDLKLIMETKNKLLTDEKGDVSTKAETEEFPTVRIY